MADRPILFNAPMVRAILREIEKPGTGKTQTRRVLDAACDAPPAFVEDGVITAFDENERPYRWPRTHAVGDRLWVREAWRTPSNWDDRAPSQLVASCIEVGYRQPWCPIHWVADGTYTNWGDWREHEPGRVRASMHLPMTLSRITLIVTDVRVQRLQDITNSDCLAEGIVADDVDRRGMSEARLLFRELWDSINAARGYGWAASPWVAAYTFRPILANIDTLKEAA